MCCYLFEKKNIFPFFYLSGPSAFQQDRTLVTVDSTMKTLVKVAFVFVFEEGDGSCILDI